MFRLTGLLGKGRFNRVSFSQAPFSQAPFSQAPFSQAPFDKIQKIYMPKGTSEIKSHNEIINLEVGFHAKNKMELDLFKNITDLREKHYYFKDAVRQFILHEDKQEESTINNDFKKGYIITFHITNLDETNLNYILKNKSNNYIKTLPIDRNMIHLMFGEPNINVEFDTNKVQPENQSRDVVPSIDKIKMIDPEKNK